MIRYDIYDQQLNPGDFICCIVRGQFSAARIASISLKGTIHINPWNDQSKTYHSVVRQLRGYNIIKTAGMPVHQFTLFKTDNYAGKKLLESA
jgi:hypothetical protein